MKEVLDIIKNGSDEAKVALVIVIFVVCVAMSMTIREIAENIMTTAAVSNGHTVFKRYGDVKAIMSKEATDKMTSAELAEQIK